MGHSSKKKGHNTAGNEAPVPGAPLELFHSLNFVADGSAGCFKRVVVSLQSPKIILQTCSRTVSHLGA